MLIPWFDEFLMTDRVTECDRYLANNFFSDEDEWFWGQECSANESETQYQAHQARIQSRKDKFEEILKVLNVVQKYNLKSAEIRERGDRKENGKIIAYVPPHPRSHQFHCCQ